MAAVEIMPGEFEVCEPAPSLHLVRAQSSDRRALPVAARRAQRARAKAQRRRVSLGAAVLASLVILAWPGHAFGGSNGVGLSSDLASSSTLSSGMVYVVQPGDTVATIARLANPVDPAIAQRAIVSELHSDVVVTGEHVLIP